MSLVFDVNSSVNSLKVFNLSAEEAVFQTSIIEVKSINNETIYANSNDLIVLPPIIKLTGFQHQVLRIAFVGDHKKLTNEKIYRLLVHGVNSEVRQSDNGKVKFIFDVSIPIVVLPENVIHKLTFKVNKSSKQHLKVSISNEGTVHEKIEKLQVFVKDEKNTFNKLIAEKEINEDILSQNTKDINLLLDAKIKDIDLTSRTLMQVKIITKNHNIIESEVIYNLSHG